MMTRSGVCLHCRRRLLYAVQLEIGGSETLVPCEDMPCDARRDRSCVVESRGDRLVADQARRMSRRVMRAR